MPHEREIRPLSFDVARKDLGNLMDEELVRYLDDIIKADEFWCLVKRLLK